MFKAWKKGHAKTLWCQGIPGAGKTILASIVIDHLEKECQKTSNDSACVYVYFDGSYRDQKTPTNVLLNLLGQLVGQREDLSQKTKDKCKEWRRRRRVPMEDLQQLAWSEIKSFTKVFLVVDALDECGTEGKTDARDDFLDRIIQLPENVNVFVTSRAQLDRRMKDAYELKITAANIEPDLRRYINYRIDRSGELKRLLATRSFNDAKLCREEIQDVVVNSVDGMFLLAERHMEMLDLQDTIGKLCITLKELPHDIRIIYDAALERIMSGGAPRKRQSLSALAWLSCSRRPMTVNEVAEAIAIQRDDKSLKDDRLRLKSLEHISSLCEGLIAVDRESGLDIFQSSAEAIVAEGCLTYLSFSDFGHVPPGEDRADYLNRFSLLNYAADHWHDHLSRGWSESNLELAVNLLVDSSKVANLAHAMSNDEIKGEAGMTGLHLVAFLGFERLVEPLSRCVNKGSRTRNSTHGRLATARTLRGETPLHWAAANNHGKVVSELIAREAEVNAKDNRGKTALHTAVRKGRREATLALLEEAKDRIDINAVDNHLSTPLILAAHHGMGVIARMLMDHKADLDAKDKDGYTALRCAASQNHRRILELLIKKGANLELNRTPDWTLLSSAVTQGHPQIVSLLLHETDEVNYVTEHGTALMCAIRYKKKDIAWLLVQNANLDVADNTGDTALHVAVREEDKSLVWLLLESGAKTTQQNNAGLTALHLAAESGKRPIVEILIDKGAELESREHHDGQTPLHIAASKGHHLVVRLLVDRGAELDAKDGRGFTPLHLATRNGHPETTQLLLSRGADKNARSKLGLTPLHVATDTAVLSALLDSGVDASIGDNNQRTALHWALVDHSRGREEAIRMLIERATDDDIDAADEDGQSALHVAVSAGHGPSVALLLLAGADMEKEDGGGRTPLQLGICRFDNNQAFQRVVWELLGRGADVNRKGQDGSTALHLAAAAGNKTAIQMLFGRAQEKPNLSIVDAEGLTAPELALKHGHTGMDWEAAEALADRRQQDGGRRKE
ncbi:ankyrin repeat-containing domain protein [Phialemonium atrogriseum]|uniref:protein S-acyltransferase n=1 Tax=Phialemonium atrogriseum TaxID=1093897 RepID=A0AAJ0C926_9PEZI|nr:ankyrin repeat-containing domain protein [Phialemonium atrogriseum]KAK1772210.1 ankyrin repeat-containing domain protein [Phialemonium atrogriseum]